MEFRIALQKISDRNAHVVLVFNLNHIVIRWGVEEFQRKRTGPEKENEKLVSAMHSAAGFRHGPAAGSLDRGNEDEAHNGS
jgi:hypothetical protein